MHVKYTNERANMHSSALVYSQK